VRWVYPRTGGGARTINAYFVIFYSEKVGRYLRELGKKKRRLSRGNAVEESKKKHWGFSGNEGSKIYED